MAKSEEKCLFCAIVAGKIPSFKVYETEKSLAFLDIAPASPGHSLVIPKYHAKTLVELPDGYLADIGPVVKKVALATGAEQYNILQNNGKLAFQHVDHVHFHVIPKNTAEDGLVIDIEGRWPAPQAPEEELAKILEGMKGKL